jgi:short-subunit dehydrogenase
VNSAVRKAVFITGASSGIGLALAYEYAARGFDLALAARRVDRLEALKIDIAARHAECSVQIHALDVTRYEDVAATIAESQKQFGRLDIVIVNAGIGSRGRVGHGYFDKHRALIETNVIGAMATCDAAIDLFKRQGFGQLVVMSSVAAFRGLPGGSAYGASKAAVATYAEAIRAETYASNIKITTIFPGFIDTPINQDIPNRPFLITPERGAKIIADKIERGVQSAVVPAFPWALMKWLAKAIPTALLAKGAR